MDRGAWWAIVYGGRKNGGRDLTTTTSMREKLLKEPDNV